MEKLLSENSKNFQNGKVKLESSMTMHDHKVEHFSWRALLYFMSTKQKGLTEELMNYMSTKWTILGGELYCISCSQNGKD